MPQKQKHPLESEVYSRILLAIGLKEINFTEIRNGINKTLPIKEQKSESTISEELNYLKRKRYIKIKIPKNRKTSEKHFYIEWKRIATEYVQYVTNTTGHKFSMTSKLIHENPYLILILQLAIKDYLKTPYNERELKTFYQIFEKITMQIVYHMPLHKWGNLTDLAEDRQKLRNLLSFTEEVEKYVAVDFEDTIENLYDYIIDNNINFELDSQKK